MATKSELLAAFERELKARYPWTQDEAKFSKFMEATQKTLNSHEDLVTLKGEAWKAALEAAGLRGWKLHRLRDLPA